MKLPIARHFVALLFCFAFTGGAAVGQQQYVELKPADSSLKWTFLYLDYGVPCPVCKSVIALAMAQKEGRPSYCSLFDKADPTKFVKPTWTKIALQPLLDQVRRVIAISNLSWDTILYQDLNSPRDSDEAQAEVFWAKYGRYIDPLIAKGDVTLETTQFDVDGDGVVEALYRVRQVGRADVGGKLFTQWTTGVCGANTHAPVFNLFALERDSSALAALLRRYSYEEGMNIFHYGDASFLWQLGPDSGSISAIRKGKAELSLQQVFDGGFYPAPNE
jgi:hypothetical protein